VRSGSPSDEVPGFQNYGLAAAASRPLSQAPDQGTIRDFDEIAATAAA
jgi:hypothetical protein